MRSSAMPRVSLSERRLASTDRFPCATSLATAAVALRLAVIVLSDFRRSPTSSLVLASTVWLRSPIATALARPTARISERLMLNAMKIAAPAPNSSETPTMLIRRIWAWLLSSRDSSERSAIVFLR